MVFLLPPLIHGFPIAQPGTEGLRVIVSGTDDIIATYRGNSAAYSNDLYLDYQGRSTFIFNNHNSPVGSKKNLGSFPYGTELIFRIHVNNTGFNYFTGYPSRNPDGHAHARVEENWQPNETLVSFEDLYRGPFNYNDLSFSFTNTMTKPPKPPIVYVDDDGPFDPKPYDSGVSDRDEDGTREHPFDMIQEGIDAVRDGGMVVVLSGMYWETVDFEGKNIEVTSFDPELYPCGPQSYPVIDGNDQGSVVTFVNGETANAKLSGFMITRGLSDMGSGILCIGSHPRISHCIVVGNRTSDTNFGAAIGCLDSYNIIENCTITDNYGGESGAGIYLINSIVNIHNSIVWANIPEQIIAHVYNPIVTYSDVQGAWPGKGNINKDPLFACIGYWTDSVDPNLLPCDPSNPNAIWVEGDYHLRSQVGRWNSNSEEWTQDDVTSPCIDAGDPASPWECEPSPNGERINTGAYGGTSQASMAWDGYILSISSTEGGSVVKPGEGDFLYYDDVNEAPIKAKADEHYHFTHWSGTAVDANKVYPSNEPNAVMTVDADYTLVANFAPIEYVTLAISSSKGGSTEPKEGIYTGIERGQSVNVFAIPETCYRFANWTGSAVDGDDVDDPNSASTSVKMNEDHTLIANFVYEYLPTILPSEGGTVVIVDIIPWSGCDILVTVKAIPDPCYKFTGWSGSAVDDGKVDSNAPAKTGFLADDKYTLQAHFEPTMIEDDFEGYDARSNQIWWAWKDGLGYVAHDDEPAYMSNGTGSAVGDETTSSFTEERIVHGGRQSMPYSYDNNMKISEATKTVDCPCDWTEAGAGVTTLSLWFRGDSPKNSPEPMFIALNGDAVVYHDDPAAARIAVWTEWSIDLQAFADQGVDLTNVDTITIGFGMKNAPTAGGQGKVYFDDIRIYSRAVRP